MNDIYAVIMAGGSGTRFWPMSRNARPKQLVRIVGDGTMIQATVARLQPLIPPERVLVVTTAALAEETRRQLPMLRPEHVIAEPMGRDTAACVCLAAVIVERIRPGAVAIMLPADQVISPADAFQQALAAGAAVARGGSLVTYGIAPRFPATGYGYVHLAERLPDVDGVVVNRVERFVEKPDEHTARTYLEHGGYRWNSGIFTWRTDAVLAELDRHCGWLTSALRPLGAAWGTASFTPRLAETYGPLKKISVDYALMEKAKDIRVITGEFAWDDVGSWDSLYDHLEPDEAGVIRRGDTLAVDCRETLLVSETGQLVAGVALERISVVATKDAILVVPKGKSQQVKQVVEALKAKGRDHLL
jgi:mannose-1-phosphate guanylyltransferase